MRADPDERPVIIFSVIPVISFLVAIWSGMLEITLFIVRVVFNKNHPSDFKVTVCSFVLVLSVAVRWWWAKSHREEFKWLKSWNQSMPYRPGITPRSAWIITLSCIASGAFGAWVFA